MIMEQDEKNPDSYRDENQENQPEVNEVKQEENPTVENAVTEKNFEQLYTEANDKFLRLYSEFENFKRRTIKERLDLIKSAGSEVAKAVLPALDDFERAMKANEQVTDIHALKEGFKMIYNKMNLQLQSKGLKRMELKGTDFNADISEAIANVPVGDETQKGKVIEVVENGYYMNDVIIRYAKVVVGN